MSNSASQVLNPLVSDEKAIEFLQGAGFLTIFDICRYTEATFIEKVPSLSVSLAKQVYAHAQHRSRCLLSLYRAYQARNEPLMRRIAKLGVSPSPTALSRALERSLGGAPDFSDLFPERSEDGYAEAESIQSLFSPGRYLVELYKVAVGLHTADSPLNLNARRPDIGALVLNEENLTEEVSTLDILIDVLQQGIQSTTGVSMTEMERIYYPMTLPYHDNLVQIRSVLSAQSSSLQQVWAVLGDYQGQQFQPLTASPPPARDIQTPAPSAREELLLTPATFELLAAQPASAATLQNHYHLPSVDISQELKPSSVFLDRTGLIFNQLVALTGQADYETSDPSAQQQSRFYMFGEAAAVPVDQYGQFYLAHQGSTPTPLLLVPGMDEPELNFTAENAVTLADRAERLVRLQPLVQLEFHQLDWLIRNANGACSPERLASPLLDQPIIEAIAEFMRLRDAYSLSSDAYACFIGDMNIYAPADQASLYEKLFTSPTEGNTLPLDVTLSFDPATPSDERALLCGGLGVSPDQLFEMAKLAFDDTTVVPMNPARFAQLYRQAMIPRMLGLTFDQARLLWRMLNPERDIAALVAGPATLEVLDVIRQSETVLQWLRDHNMPLEEALSLITDHYSDSVTPELFNFTHNIYTSLSTDQAATSYEPEQPLTDSLRQNLYRLTASVFKIKANVMGRLIDWLDQHFTSASSGATQQEAVPYGLGNFWSDVEALFRARTATRIDEMYTTPNIARYAHAMAQYALIAQWANLTEQDLTLIVDSPAWFMGGGGHEAELAPRSSLEVLLYISRLKEWQQRVVVSQAEAMTYFAVANTPSQTADLALSFLAYIQGWDPQTTRDMNAYLVYEQLYADFPKSFVQVLQLEAWMQVGIQAGVGAQCVQGLYRMSLEQAQAEDSTLIQDVAEALVATLQN